MEQKDLNIGAIAYKKFDLNNRSSSSLMLLLDKVEELDQPMSFEELLNELMEASRHIMKTEASSLMLLDEEEEELHVILPTGPVKEEIRGKRIPKNKGFGGWVVQHKMPLIVNDVSEQSELFGGELSENFKTRNLICAPLLDNEFNVLGVIQAVNRYGSSGFEEEDLAVFQALAKHAARAIERHRSQEKMDLRLKEKDLLLSELHHRMKNNLALINGMVQMEEANLKDNGAREILKKIQVRIKSLNLVYELLSEKGMFTDVELEPYLTKIVGGVSEALTTPERKINIEVDIDDIAVHPEQALSCGLIINELLVNSYKHAFKYKDEGLISVRLFKAGDLISLVYKDDGVGFPEGFDPESYESLGFQIIRALVKKLKGSLAFSKNGENNGISSTLEFPSNDASLDTKTAVGT